jgi:hypothetical protein
MFFNDELRSFGGQVSPTYFSRVSSFLASYAFLSLSVGRGLDSLVA